MANDDFSGRPRCADSKNPIFIFSPFLGLGHLQGLGVRFGRILGVPSIEPFLGEGGGPAGGLYRPPPPPPPGNENPASLLCAQFWPPSTPLWPNGRLIFSTFGPPMLGLLRRPGLAHWECCHASHSAVCVAVRFGGGFWGVEVRITNARRCLGAAGRCIWVPRNHFGVRPTRKLLDCTTVHHRQQGAPTAR